MPNGKGLDFWASEDISRFFLSSTINVSLSNVMANAPAHCEPPYCVLSAQAEPQPGGDAVERVVSLWASSLVR
jgi:hypothetical protein